MDVAQTRSNAGSSFRVYHVSDIATVLRRPISTAGMVWCQSGAMPMKKCTRSPYIGLPPTELACPPRPGGRPRVCVGRAGDGPPSLLILMRQELDLTLALGFQEGGVLLLASLRSRREKLRAGGGHVRAATVLSNKRRRRGRWRSGATAGRQAGAQQLFSRVRCSLVVGNRCDHWQR